MTTLQFADTHNLVAFLAKPAESEGFEQVVDFLNAHTIKYALTLIPYNTSLFEQFWATVKLKTVNREQQLQSLVDGKKIVVTEASVRRDLQLDDDEVHAQEELGECYQQSHRPHPTAHHLTQPSTSQPQKTKIKRKVKRKDTEVPQPSDPTNVADEAVNEESSMQLKELMDFCTKLQQRVLDLENTKIALSLGEIQVKEESQEVREERRVTHKLRRLYQVGRSARVVSFDEARITLDSTHFDADTNMFGVHDLDGDEVVVESEVAAKKKYDEVNVVEEVVSAAEETINAATIIEDEITLARALAELKSKVTTATTTTTKGILLQETSESITTTTIPLKDKGKAEFDEEVRLAREKDEANVALIEEWNDIQAKIDADYQMAKQMQAEEQEELSIEEKSKLFVQLLEARKKHFAAKRVEEKRNRPPTRAQQRSIMYMDTELIEGSEVRAEGSVTRKESSSKRAGDELEQEKAKKQKVDEDKETVELQSLMEVIPDEEEVAVDATPLATKPQSIVD
ncbi:hypothetical protein Tco_0626228 [Tanacetum coccineum]|uniref:Xylulose kinase-1 n=1 Tax=Tanacetum coccineum TaxID=301880 RepID=A0ABQ4WIY4_9ASTR